jgi:hypothetical protein
METPFEWSNIVANPRPPDQARLSAGDDELEKKWHPGT